MSDWHKHRHHTGGSDPWICHVCGEAYPVQSMARDCEDRHENEGEIEG